MQLPQQAIAVPAWRDLASGLVVPSSVADRLEPARAGLARRVVFAEQYLTVLQRILVQHARDATLTEEATEDELRATIAAYFAAASVTSAADEHLKQGEPTPEEWLVYLTKNGSYNN